ncbi:phosphatase PAP2 family protein [Salinicola halophilus]|uniref:phosphatase PAP2 family protein n=1 Tax=Salinicola halophilus TaxID=184065 RepID=UPI0013A65C26|nr:phosphatase PAP2 family protein [Salinicola halophilus]
MALAIAGCSDSSSDDDDDGDSVSVSKPAKPTGVGSSLDVAEPAVAFPLPTLDYAANNADGDLRYDLNQNAIAYVLRGINDIWKGTSDLWQSGANGDGPDRYLTDPIVDAKIWKENIQYVIDVTQNRSDEQAILAFLDDQRSKNYSIIDGYGPLTEAYVEGSGANVTIPVPTVDQVLNDPHYQSVHNDNISFAGDMTSELGEVVTLVDAFRQRAPASTSASKYIFSTPRPWRMNDEGEVAFQGTEKDYECIQQDGVDASTTYDVYESSVSVVPGLMCSRRAHNPDKEAAGLYSNDTENRRKDGGYPSGHTNAGYLASMAMAYALPQRYSEMLTRGSLLGDDRIVAGMHSPVDVIGGRVHALNVASYALNQPDIASEAQAAYDRAQQYFGDMAEAEDMSLYDFAHRDVENEAGLIDGDKVNVEVYDNDDYDDHDANKRIYRERLTYGLSQDASQAGQDPVVPAGAQALLKSRQPYLSDDQRRAVLYTTAIDSGYPILDDTNGWGRLDLVTAADGYGAFDGDVSVTMDASEDGFNAKDWWRNDITGDGMLTKSGSGHLVLTGDNRYGGGTLLQEGTLEATSTSAFGSGDLYVENGTLRVDTADADALQIAGDFTMDDGTLAVADGNQIVVDGLVYLSGGKLQLEFDGEKPETGTEVAVIKAGSLHGEFAEVDAEGVAVELRYDNGSVTAIVQ